MKLFLSNLIQELDDPFVYLSLGFSVGILTSLLL